MPGFTCCVPGCYNNSHRDRELRFYTFPKDNTQREIWLKNISRAGVSGCFSTFQPTTGHRVCSVHFPGGRKTYTIRVPTLFPLRGVNERKSRRGKNRNLSTALPILSGAVSSPVAVNAALTDGAQESGGEAVTDTTTVVQIGQNGQYISPIDLAGQADGACLTSVVSSSTDLAAGGEPQVSAAVQAQSLSYSTLSGSLDHSYSLTTGTTSAELLKKLNEQRDIIALMEVKMKEMKSTIRQLKVTEAKLQEEVRERDRMLSTGAAVVRKKL